MKLALLIFLSSINQTLGYPSAAGSCTTVGGIHSKPGKGALSSGDFQVSLAGTILNPSTPHIIEHCPSSFESKATLNLSGIAENTFRGFVINVSSDSGTDISDALIADGSEEGSPQEFPLNFGISCPPGVSGVCHTSREDKSLVSVVLDSDIIGDLPSDKETWSLNVIAVVANNFLDGRDLWYESKYAIEIQNKCVVENTEPEPEVVDPKPEPVDVDTEVVDTESIEPEPVDVDTEIVDTESIDPEPIDVDNEDVDTESIDSEPLEPSDPDSEPDSEPESNANIMSSTLITSVLVTFSVLLTF